MNAKRLEHELETAISAWHLQHAPATVARMTEIGRRFARRLAQDGVESFREVTADQARGFITATARSGRAPAIATTRSRRTTVRAIYRQLRAAGYAVGDPSLDVMLAARGRNYSRPLTDDEIRLCRAVASASPVGPGPVGRRAVAWAFAESGATTGEIPQVTLADLDHEHTPSTVRLPGTRHLHARTVELTDWGSATVTGHLANHQYAPGASITYRGQGGKPGSNSPLARSCQQIVEILKAAGVAPSPDVRPASIRHWAGRTAFERGATLDQVAALLGLTSLDSTAARIGLDWSITPITLEAQR